MTDAHCHVSGGDPTVREFLIGRDFVGIHPWDVRENCRIAESSNYRNGGVEETLSMIRKRLEANSNLGVGEIGLDRLKEKNVSPEMREMFEAQLQLAFSFHRPVVLHGAKCWGDVVHTILRLLSDSTIRQFDDSTISPLLFHGFSRSDGLIPDIVKFNGYISVGPAVLNDHAVNYRELVKKIPLDRLLVETDRTEVDASECPTVREVLAKTAELRGVSAAELERITDANADAFVGGRVG